LRWYYPRDGDGDPARADPEVTRVAIKARLAEAFGFDHATVETCAEAPVEAAGR